ncbi:MAG TPA: hypothetical protein VG938_19220 [Verrucomicrobiae bacterium]|nr:hypothetical protein [Verrucomicrobiae bacterium]
MAHFRRDEKHYCQLPHRLGTPLIREVLAAFRRNELPATAAAEKLNLGCTRFYELYADYLRADAKHQPHLWSPGHSGGDHAADWPPGVEALVRKLLSARTPAPYRFAAFEVHRRLGFQIDPATVRRWAIANNLGHPTPSRREPASIRRWQCLKIGALWQLDATPHRWFPGNKRNYPLLDLLDDCSRVCTGAQIHHAEDLLAYFDFLPAAFIEHGLPLELYVDCHSFFFPQHPEALTQLGAACTSTVSPCATPALLRPKAKSNASINTGRVGSPLCSLPKILPLQKPPTNSCLPCATIATLRKSIANWAALPMPPPTKLVGKIARSCVRSPLPLVALHLEHTHHFESRPRRPRACRCERLPAGVAAGTRVIQCLHPNGTVTILAREPKST